MFLIHPIDRSAPLGVVAVSVATALSLQNASAQSLAAPAEVQQVVVTATRFPTSTSQLPASVQIITADQIADSGATSVNEALMRVLAIPGRLDFFGGGNYGLDLRGFGSTADNNQVVIVDGLRLSEPDLSGTRLSGIPIESVSRIEVLRGSSAVLYGEGATAGAIVITTRAAEAGSRVDDRPWQAAVSASLGTMASRDGSVLARWRHGDWTAQVSAKRAESDNHRPNARSRLDAGEVALGWRSSGWRWGLKHAQDDTDARLPGALPYADYLRDPVGGLPLYSADNAQIAQRRTQVYGQGEAAGWSLSAEGGWRDKDLRSFTTSSWGGSRFDYRVNARDLTFKGQRDWTSVGWQQRTQWGADHRRWDRQNNFGSQALSEAAGVFLRHEWDIGTQTSASAGLRAETIDRAASFSRSQRSHPRAWEAGLTQRMSPTVVAWGRMGGSFRAASVDELAGAGGTMPDLRIQTSADRELGLRWSSLGRRIDVRAYRHALTDEIAYDPNVPGAFGFGANVNLPPTLRQGIEMDMGLPITENWRMQPHLAWRVAEFRSGPRAGQAVPLVSRQTAGIRLLGLWGGGHQLSGGVNWVGSQFVDEANTCRVPSYHLADVRYAYVWRSMEASIAVGNLTGQRYFSTAFNCAGGQPASVYPEAGRTMGARVKVDF